MTPAAPPATHRLPLRWRDLDHQGHVYHAEFLTLADEGRTRWLSDVLGVEEPQSYVIAHISIDYVSELTHPAGYVDFGLRIERIGGESVRTAETLSTADGTVVARLVCVFLLWDAGTRETRGLSEPERALAVPYLQSQDHTNRASPADGELTNGASA